MFQANVITAVDGEPVTTRSKRPTKRTAGAEQEPEPEPATRRSRRRTKTIPEEPAESAEPEKRATRSSKRKIATTEIGAKQRKNPAKKRKLK